MLVLLAVVVTAFVVVSACTVEVIVGATVNKAATAKLINLVLLFMILSFLNI